MRRTGHARRRREDVAPVRPPLAEHAIWPRLRRWIVGDQGSQRNWRFALSPHTPLSPPAPEAASLQTAGGPVTALATRATAPSTDAKVTNTTSYRRREATSVANKPAHHTRVPRIRMRG